MVTEKKVETNFYCGPEEKPHHTFILFYIPSSKYYYPMCPQHGYMTKKA